MDLRTDVSGYGRGGSTAISAAPAPIRAVGNPGLRGPVPFEGAAACGSVAPGVDRAWMAEEDRQMSRLLVAGFLLFLVPATVGRATGWRWRPWPPGPDGYGSIVSEARQAADTYVPIAFTGM